eukprot:6174656-Pleurochrysis_carterae.AAC.1
MEVLVACMVSLAYRTPKMLHAATTSLHGGRAISRMRFQNVAVPGLSSIICVSLASDRASAASARLSAFTHPL